MTAQLCFKSLYELCKCSLQTHLMQDLPIIDSHCHLDECFNNSSFLESLSTSSIRKVYAVSNKHKFKNWNKLLHLSNENLYVYESFGMYPKYLPDYNLNERLIQLTNIVSKKQNSVSGRPIVAIGEIGLDETSRFSITRSKISSRKSDYHSTSDRFAINFTLSWSCSFSYFI